jgi:hypothetical protein
VSRPGSVKGCPKGRPLGALDGFRSGQTMISAGDGILNGTPAVIFRSFMPGRREQGRGVRREAAAGERDGGQLVRAVPGVTRARPPAVAVIGLRRSGRTGNGEGPPRAHRARLPARAVQLTVDTGTRQRAQDQPRR